jgi:phosphosulfolactate synthase
MYNDLFSELPINRREGKPREKGITVIIDHGLGVHTQKDILDASCDYIDIAKIMVGIPALLGDRVLRKKIDLYHKNDILTFPGGQFLEWAYTKEKSKEYFTAVVKSGFKLVEVSDNIMDISPSDKSNLVRIVSQEYGLKVLGETGSKKVSSSTKALIKDIQNCLESGAWKVMFEAAELFENGIFKKDLIDEISNEVDINKLIFELPGGWISGITISHIYSLQVWLIEKLGNEVNIGNVDPGEVLCLEAERNNLGTHMKV